MVILEYAPHGNLLTFLKSRRDILKPVWKKQEIGMENELTTCDLAAIAYQVAKGMEFLASRRVCVYCIILLPIASNYIILHPIASSWALYCQRRIILSSKMLLGKFMPTSDMV